MKLFFFLKKKSFLCFCSYSCDVGFYSGNNWSSRRKKSFWMTITSSLPKQATHWKTYDCNRDKTTPNNFLLYTRKAMGSMIYPSHPQLSSGFYHFPKACTYTKFDCNRAEPNLACSSSIGSNLAKNSKLVKLGLKKINLDMPFPSQGSSMGAMF